MVRWSHFQTGPASITKRPSELCLPDLPRPGRVQHLFIPFPGGPVQKGKNELRLNPKKQPHKNGYLAAKRTREN